MKPILYMFIFMPMVVTAQQKIPQGIDSVNYSMPKYTWSKKQIDSVLLTKVVSITAGNAEIVTGIYPNFTVAIVQPTIATPTRIFGTTFTVSTTKAAFVFYTVNISCTATIGSTALGKVSLQYSLNAGSTWIDVSDVSNSNTVTLAIVLNSVTASDSIIWGIIPANALVRLVSTITGTTTNTFVRSQEITY